MAVRTAKAGTWAVGNVGAAADFNKLPGGWIGYAEVTAGQSGISAQTDLTNLTVTVTAGTSRRLCAEGWVQVQQQTVAGSANIYMVEDGTIVQTSTITLLNGGNFAVHTPKVVRTPGSGSRTYKLRGDVGAGTVDVRASSTQPAFILVTDLGPAS